MESAPIASAWRFGRFTLDPARGGLLADGGAELPLRPKSFALLRLLVEHAGRLLERDAIMAAVWPNIAVTDESITQCIRDIRRALGDEAQLLIRTVPRRGYLLAAEVVRVERDGGAPPSRQREAAGGRGPPTPLPPELPDRPSIAVLPFQNLSGDPGQDYFADGMVEDITTELARLRWLFVIARNSSFTYRGRAVDVRQIGRELGVRYVLEGSVRRSGARVRMTGQLIEAASGVHLWADRFDGDAGDVFDLQDQLTASVVGAMAPRLEQAEIERAKRKPTESLDAYDYFLRGLAAFHCFTPADNSEAAALFGQATQRDPGFASAYGMAARCQLQRKAFGWAVISPAEVADAERLARRAAELGRDDPVALGAAGGALLTVVGEVEEGAALVDRATTLTPNLAWVWNYSAYARLLLGEPEAAIEHAARAMRLSPHDAQMFGLQAATAFGHFFAGRYGEASAWAQAAIRERPGFLVATCIAAASAALAGRSAEAAKAMERLRRLNPALRIANLDGLLPFRRPDDRILWSEALRAAGLP